MALVLLLWLVPMAWRGLLHRPPPGLPSALATLSNVSCLFSRATPTWTVFYVEVRDREGGPWRVVDDGLDFGLQPFGHRTRLHRYLVRWGDPGDEPARDEAAQYLFARQRAREPEHPWVELRFVRAPIPVRADRPPTGAWQRPELREIPANHRRILSTHRPEAAP